MSILWEEAVDSSTGFTIERYFLYTKDQKMTYGGTINLEDPSSFDYPIVHTDYWFPGNDAANAWLLVGSYEISLLRFVEVYVQDPILAEGKRLLINLNSGPTTLALRSDTEFIMNNPPSSISLGISRNWVAVVSGVDSQFGFTTNALPEYNQGAKLPLTTGRTREVLTFTEDEAHNQQGHQFVTQQQFNLVNIAQTAGDLQNPGGGIGVTQGITSSIYTGGDMVIYSSFIRLTSNPAPNMEVSCRIAGTFLLNATGTTQVHSAPAGPILPNHTTYYFRIQFTPLIPIGTDLSTLGGSYTVKSTILNPLFLDAGGDETDPFADPWVSFKCPPPYQITSLDNKCITGGFIAQ